MTPEQLAALRVELTDDPEALGYAPYVPKGPGHLVDLMNKPRATMLRERFVTTRTVLAELSLDHARALLGALRAAAQVDPVAAEGMELLRRDPGIDVAHSSTRAVVAALLDAKAITQEVSDAVLALGQLPSSRAEVLFGAGFVLTERDVRAALSEVR